MTLDLMPRVGVETLSIYRLMLQRQMVMTSCHSDVKEYAGAMLDKSCRFVQNCGVVAASAAN